MASTVYGLWHLQSVVVRHPQSLVVWHLQSLIGGCHSDPGMSSLASEIKREKTSPLPLFSEGVGLISLVLSVLRCRRPTSQLSFPLPLCWETANSLRGNNHKSRTYACEAKPFPKFLTAGP